MEKTIEVKSVEEKTSKKGDKYLVVEADKRYGCWDEDLFGRLHSGGTLVVEIQKKGNFENIVAVKDASDAPVQSAQQSTVPVVAEPNFRLNLKQNSRGIYWDVTVRGESLDELKQRLTESIALAESTIAARGVAPSQEA